jgi:hypothetical protein
MKTTYVINGFSIRYGNDVNVKKKWWTQAIILSHKFKCSDVQKSGYGKYDDILRLTKLVQCLYKEWSDSFTSSRVVCVPAGLSNPLAVPLRCLGITVYTQHNALMEAFANCWSSEKQIIWCISTKICAKRAKTVIHCTQSCMDLIPICSTLIHISTGTARVSTLMSLQITNAYIYMYTY